MRKPQVTRTFVSTKAVLLCVDVENPKETFNDTIIVPRTYPTPAKLEKKVKAMYETGSKKVVAIVSSEEVEELRGMSEEDFLKYSVVLDPETRKAIEE